MKSWQLEATRSQQLVTLSKRLEWSIFSTGWKASVLLRWAFTMRATRFGGRRSKQKRQISRRCGGSVASAASSSDGRLLAACYHAATGLSSTPGPQQLFAEEQHLLHSQLLKLASGWSVNPSHANSGRAVFTSLTSSSTVPSRAKRSLARFLISDSRRGRTACYTLI